MTIQLKTIDLDRAYTADEFEALPDDGNRYQLINGRLIKMPPAGFQHGDIIGNLHFHLRLYDPEKKVGTILPPTGFRLDADNTPEPDLMYVVASRRPSNDSKQALQAIPDLVVEVWSPSQLTKQGLDADSMAKIRKYQKAGVKLIWSINPDTRTVVVYHPDQADPIATLGLYDELDGEQVIPGFKLKVSKLFE